MAEKFFIERFDIALLQELYSEHKNLGEYRLHEITGMWRN